MNETIGNNIRERRTSANLTALELGAAMGLKGASARTSVWRWERGMRLSLETVERLAYALGCEAWELCRP